MAYTSYEILPARTINNRIVPRLWKLIRNDGSFDLYCLSSLQHNCIQYLTSIGEAGVWTGRWNIAGLNDLGGYYPNVDYSDFLVYSTFIQDNTRYASYPYCGFRMKFDNSAMIYPYQIYGASYSGHNGGERLLRVFDGTSWVTKAYGTGNWGYGMLWGTNLEDLNSIFDWKDYTELQVMFRAWDGSKYTGATSNLAVNFIHRYTDGHPLHRYYR